jgi:hypothetical protein
MLRARIPGRRNPSSRLKWAWWEHGRVSENTPEQPSEHPLGALIGDWLDWKATAAELDVTVAKVRTLIREHQLAAAVPAEGAGQQVPAELLLDGDVVKGVPGLLTMLSDGGWDDVEILTWMFTVDDSLPGRPIDALRENRGSEVKRRAQALALS